MEESKQLAECAGFDWDKGNLLKNWQRHRVTASECEQVFFNQPLILASDEKHSQQESRFFGLGRTNDDRRLFVVFTIRGRLIRIISARDMNRIERKVYEAS